MTAAPMQRILQAVAAHHRATEAGHMDGPPPGTPRHLVRLTVVEEDGHRVLLAVCDRGWEYRTRLADGEAVDLLTPDRPIVLH